MRRAAIIAAIGAGAALRKYMDRHWNVVDQHGQFLSKGYVQNQTACSIIASWPSGLHYRRCGEYEEWRCKARFHNPEHPVTAEPKTGICRVCGCNQRDACWLDPPGRPCAWSDDSKTICDHPQCLAKASNGE